MQSDTAFLRLRFEKLDAHPKNNLNNLNHKIA
jgi:hypothetical protein